MGVVWVHYNYVQMEIELTTLSWTRKYHGKFFVLKNKLSIDTSTYLLPVISVNAVAISLSLSKNQQVIDCF